MVGLPSQTPEILVDDLILMRMLDIDMLGIGPFIPHHETPLAGIENNDRETTLRVIAIARLITRNTNIPATTALATMHPRGHLLALRACANIVMPDFAPDIYRSQYDIYPGRTDVGSAEQIMNILKNDFESIVRTIGKSAGNRHPKSL